MKQLTIMFDYDDVLFPLVTPWVNKLNSIHNTNVLPNEIAEWDITKFFPMLTKKQVFAPLFEDEFWLKQEPTNNGVETLQNIKSEGHIIKVVTSTYYQNIQPKMERLFQCYPFLTWDDVTVTSCKQDVRGDLLVDDNPDNLIGGDYYKVLLNAPHNMKFDTNKSGVIRIKSIDQVLSIVSKISK